MDGLFAQRRATFAEGARWVAKPLMLNAMQCALHGWTCVGTNEIACESCKAVLKVDVMLGDVLEAVKVPVVLRQLQTTHAEYCQWMDNYMAASHALPVLAPRKEAVRALKDRYRGLVQSGVVLPRLGGGGADDDGWNTAGMPSDSDARGQVQRARKLVEGEATEMAQRNKTIQLQQGERDDREETSASQSRMEDDADALFLAALCGWRVDQGQQKDDDADGGSGRETGVLLCCDQCQRRANFGRKGVQKTFNVLMSHRAHCPWRTPPVLTLSECKDRKLHGQSCFRELLDIVLKKKKTTKTRRPERRRDTAPQR